MVTEQVLEAMRNLYETCRKAGWSDNEFCTQFNVTKRWVSLNLKKTEKN